MHQRTIALTSAALLSVVALSACRPGGGSNSGGPPPFNGKDCGTIDAKQANSADNAAVLCYDAYHLPPFPSVRLSVVDGSKTTIYQTPGGKHMVYITVKITDANGKTSSTTRNCGNGAGFPLTGQAFITARGQVSFQC
jgi:hypothetical protein